MRTTTRIALVLGVVALLGHAQGAELFGVTPTAGAVGDGRITAQISWEGTVICLRWPNATFYEHVNYNTAPWDAEDRNKNGWLLPHYGARPNQGIFAGLVTTDSAGVTRVRWLRDAPTRSFAYADERSNRLVARYGFADGTWIEEESFVVPDEPALIRGWRLVTAPPDTVTAAIVVVANMALRAEHPAYNPLPQTEEDDAERFATFALPKNRLLVSALPRRLSAAQREAVVALAVGDPTTDEVRDFVEEAATPWGEGVYFVQSTQRDGWRAWQVGVDADAGPAVGGEDAFADAGDGRLSGRLVAVSRTTTAMLIDFDDRDEAAWYGVFGATVTAAVADALRIRRTELAAWRAVADDWWARWTEGLILPEEPTARRFALRALISLRTGTDPDSGAIVASTSCEPPYNVDWPRDGAFFQFVYDLNGKFAEADRHARFYPKIQYQEDFVLAPAGAFPMNAYADGVTGGPIPFEIDQVGFVLWAYYVHAAFLYEQDPAAARAFAEAIRASAAAAAEVLVTCKDETTGLQCPANEDDHPELTQSNHGAITTWLGLVAARRLFAALGDTARSERYADRAAELAAAIRTHFHPADHALGDGAIGDGDLGWAYWPARFWGPKEVAAHTATRNQFKELLQRRFFDARDYLIYDTKMTIPMQLAPLATTETRELVARIHRVYLDEVVTPGTLHLSEFIDYYDLDEDGMPETWINRVATPHLWAQVLLYLSLLAAERPELLTVPELPAGALVPPAAPTGCGCSLTSGAGASSGSLLLALGLLVTSIRWWRGRAPQRSSSLRMRR